VSDGCESVRVFLDLVAACLALPSFSLTGVVGEFLLFLVVSGDRRHLAIVNWLSQLDSKILVVINK
jgi:hypothetical protein